MKLKEQHLVIYAPNSCPPHRLSNLHPLTTPPFDVSLAAHFAFDFVCGDGNGNGGCLQFICNLHKNALQQKSFYASTPTQKRWRPGGPNRQTDRQTLERRLRREHS